MDNIYTRLINMDTSVTEQVVKNGDDTYTIFLNARLSWEQVMLGYAHAMHHIVNGDFDRENADRIETASHSR